MAVSIGAGFALHRKLVIDDRSYYETVADMVAAPENWLPEMIYAFVKETGKMYLFNRDNEPDDLGKWRLFDPDGAALTQEIVSAVDIGMIKEGKTYAPGTSFEQIFIDLFAGKELQEDDFYYGAVDDRNVISLYQFDGSTSSKCTVVADNKYVVFAAKESLGDFNIHDSNGFQYNNDFDKQTLTHNGIVYNVMIGKYRITTSGFEYRLTFN